MLAVLPRLALARQARPATMPEVRPGERMSPHKDEAQKAIQHVLNMLGRAEPLVGPERAIAQSALVYARSHVTAIEEAKRPRRQERDADSGHLGRDVK